MYLADNEIVEWFLEAVDGYSHIQRHAVLAPTMKVLDIDERLPEIYYTLPEELRGIVNDIFNNPDPQPLDKPDVFCYNEHGRHRIAVEDGVIHVYYSYRKEKDVQY